MKTYVLNIYQPDGPVPAPEVLTRIRQDLDAMNTELRASGRWVFAGGLHGPDSAKVVRLNGADVVATDGPFAEAKEHIGGFTIIKANDLEDALSWAGRLTQATTLPVEVRAFQG